MRKIAKVVKILFGTAVKKYPSFFVLEAFKTFVQIGMPFVGILLTPLIVDEVCGARDMNRLIRLAAVLIVTECVLAILQEALSSQINKYQ